MAPLKFSVKPLISSGRQLKSTSTRFLAYRSNQWTKINNGASSVLRFVPSLHNPLHRPLHLPFSIRLYLLLPCTPLSSLLRPRPPHLRPSLRPMKTPQAASDSTESSSSSTKTVRLMIKGRVQGVFYRDWTVSNATELGLKGWVRNRRDGSVETLLSGKPDAVEEMEQRCRRGPPSAMVTGLEVFPCDEDPGSGFERKKTEVYQSLFT